MIYLDTETEPFGLGRMAPPLVVLTVGGADGAVLVHRDDAHDVAAEILRGPLAGLNVAYDLAVLGQQFPDLLPLIFDAYDDLRVEDTAIRAQLHDLTRGEMRPYGYGLADLTKRLLGVELAKGEDTWRTRYGELADIPCSEWPADARAYAEADVIATAQCHEALGPVADEHRQTRAAWWIHLMSVWGICTSADKVERFAAEARENHRLLGDELVRLGLRRPDRTNRKGVIVVGARDTKAATARMQAVFAARGEEAPKSLDKDACERSGDVPLLTYAAYSSATKVLSSDVKLLRRPNPIHAHFNPLLETGDIGCADPNLVNLPTTPGVRECFIPREGFVFLASDYSGIQLRTWAQACINLLGYSSMADALNAGDDPHTMVAASLKGVEYAELRAQPKASYYFERQCGKVANFGLPGGMGVDRLIHAARNQYHVDITKTQATGIRRSWERRWREARPYLERVRAMTEAGKIAVTQYYSGRVRGGIGYCDTANTIFSALSYDALKDAGAMIARECYVGDGPLRGSRIVNAIHDELILEVPEALGHECAEEVERLMCLAATKWIPDVKPSVESVLMRHWSKKAERVVVDGRLMPWPTT